MLLLSFSGTTWGQSNEYPKKVVYQGDTVVMITMAQVDSMNIAYASINQNQELNDSLRSAIEGYEVVVIKDKEIISELESKGELKDEIIAQKDVIVEEQEKEKKKLIKKNKRLKFFNGVLMVTSIVLGVVVVISTL